jgi:Ca-activated chloride channel family protein
MQSVMAGLKIPIYTIGYNAKLDVLQQLSAINEAASLNADAADIAYQIGAMLNAQM